MAHERAMTGCCLMADGSKSCRPDLNQKQSKYADNARGVEGGHVSRRYLKKVGKLAVGVDLRFCEGAPHRVQILLPGLNQPLQGRPSFVAEDK